MAPIGIKKRYWFAFNYYIIAEHFLGKKLFNVLFKTSKQKLFSKLEKELQGSNRGEVLEPNIVYDKDIDKKVLRKKYLKNIMSPIIFKGGGSRLELRSKLEY